MQEGNENSESDDEIIIISGEINDQDGESVQTRQGTPPAQTRIRTSPPNADLHSNFGPFRQESVTDLRVVVLNRFQHDRRGHSSRHVDIRDYDHRRRNRSNRCRSETIVISEATSSTQSPDDAEQRSSPGPVRKARRRRRHLPYKKKYTVPRELSPPPVNPCPICWKDMLGKEGSTDVSISSTPCKHLFCTLCLETALIFKAECPLCRNPIPEQDHYLIEHFGPLQGPPTDDPPHVDPESDDVIDLS